MFEFIKSLLTKDKSKDEIVKSTFNGIDITDIIKTNDILEKIMTLKSNNISEDNTNKILYDLNNNEGRVILIDINSQFSTILDYECFKGFNFSFNIFYIYRKNNKINILLNTNETTKQYILNDEVEELLLDILNKNFD